MNTLIPIDPWGFLEDILHVGNTAIRTIRAQAAGRFPPVNIFLDDDAAILDLELPGKTAADVELTLEPQAVVIADKPAKSEDEKATAAAPAWSRRIDLPFRVDAKKANAKFRDGILRIELPKAEAEGVRKIEIA